MAAPTIAALRLGIQTRLETITALNTAPYLPGKITPPMAVVLTPNIPNYHETMQRGFFELTFEIMVLVGAVLDQQSQDLLTSFADVTGTNSVITALEGDKSLGGIAEDSMVVDFRQLSDEEVNLIHYRGGMFTMRVAAKGV